jgi:hypothetical protein
MDAIGGLAHDATSTLYLPPSRHNRSPVEIMASVVGRGKPHAGITHGSPFLKRMEGTTAPPAVFQKWSGAVTAPHALTTPSLEHKAQSVREPTHKSLHQAAPPLLEPVGLHVGEPPEESAQAVFF